MLKGKYQMGECWWGVYLGNKTWDHSTDGGKINTYGIGKLWAMYFYLVDVMDTRRPAVDNLSL